MVGIEVNIVTDDPDRVAHIDRFDQHAFDLFFDVHVQLPLSIRLGNGQ